MFIFINVFCDLKYIINMEEIEMKGEEDGYEDNGEDYDIFLDEVVVLRLVDC